MVKSRRGSGERGYGNDAQDSWRQDKHVVAIAQQHSGHESEGRQQEHNDFPTEAASQDYVTGLQKSVNEPIQYSLIP